MIYLQNKDKIHEGYLMLDHRASPGFTPDEAIQLGYTPGLTSEGQLFETKTNHCSHCGTVVILNPSRVRERAHCNACDKDICDNCGIEMKMPFYDHKTYKQKLEEGLSFLSNSKEL